MSWRPATRKDAAALLRLILKEEALCVPLSSRFKEQTRGAELYVCDEGKEDFDDCLLHSPYGLLLPLFRSSQRDRADLRGLVQGLRPTVHSIMGVGSWVRETEDCLPLPPTTRVEYHLMAVTRADYVAPAKLKGAVTVRAATPADAAALFPLQRSYEKEEVVLNPALFNDAQCMRLLKKSLREELIIVAERDGAPVAKAGTNARGYGVDQIGGVFTVPEERGRGLASAVMAVLLDVVLAEKGAASLFVKKSNGPALGLYQGLGFRILNDYVISYYGL
jgi:predicted GNAT family acetyltransferase